MAEQIENKKNNLSGILLVINVILLIGLGVLYYLFFTQKDNTPVKHTPVEINRTEPGSSIRIAYINSDTILTQYTLAIKKSIELEAKGRRMEADVLSRQEQYEKDATYFQEQIQSNALSEESAQFIYSQLMEEQQKIMELQEKYAGELAQAEYNINVILLDSVTHFLDRLNIQYGYDYILGYTKTGNIFHANTDYDITRIVIEGLNREYTEKQGEE